MNADGLIFLVIAALAVAVQLLRWAVHRHRNKALGIPVSAELTREYDPDRMPPPAVGDEPRPGHRSLPMLGGGWQPPTGGMKQSGRDRD